MSFDEAEIYRAMFPEPRFPQARAAWGRFLYWWQLMLGAPRRVPRIERMGTMRLMMLPGVFDGILLKSGKFFASALNVGLVPPGCRILDMGTGSGIVAIRAAQLGAVVTAVDINPEAVRCARINVLLNRLEDRVRVVEGDLFEPVRGERFDRILFNPPFYRQTPRDVPDAAWRSTDAFDRFLAGLDRMLSARGAALALLSSRGDLMPALEAASAGWRIAAAAREDVFHEVFTLYRIERFAIETFGRRSARIHTDCDPYYKHVNPLEEGKDLSPQRCGGRREKQQ